jgi:hypothetical protein
VEVGILMASFKNGKTVHDDMPVAKRQKKKRKVEFKPSTSAHDAHAAAHRTWTPRKKPVGVQQPNGSWIFKVPE